MGMLVADVGGEPEALGARGDEADMAPCEIAENLRGEVAVDVEQLPAGIAAGAVQGAGPDRHVGLAQRIGGIAAMADGGLAIADQGDFSGHIHEDVSASQTGGHRGGGGELSAMADHGTPPVGAGRQGGVHLETAIHGDHGDVALHRTEGTVAPVPDHDHGLSRRAGAEQNVLVHQHANGAGEAIEVVTRLVAPVADGRPVEANVRGRVRSGGAIHAVAAYQGKPASLDVDENVALQSGGVETEVIAVPTVADGGKAIIPPGPGERPRQGLVIPIAGLDGEAVFVQAGDGAGADGDVAAVISDRIVIGGVADEGPVVARGIFPCGEFHLASGGDVDIPAVAQVGRGDAHGGPETAVADLGARVRNGGVGSELRGNETNVARGRHGDGAFPEAGQLEVVVAVTDLGTGGPARSGEELEVPIAGQNRDRGSGDGGRVRGGSGSVAAMPDLHRGIGAAPTGARDGASGIDKDVAAEMPDVVRIGRRAPVADLGMGVGAAAGGGDHVSASDQRHIAAEGAGARVSGSGAPVSDLGVAVVVLPGEQVNTAVVCGDLDVPAGGEEHAVAIAAVADLGVIVKGRGVVSPSLKDQVSRAHGNDDIPAHVAEKIAATMTDHGMGEGAESGGFQSQAPRLEFNFDVAGEGEVGAQGDLIGQVSNVGGGIVTGAGVQHDPVRATRAMGVDDGVAGEAAPVENVVSATANGGIVGGGIAAAKADAAIQGCDADIAADSIGRRVGDMPDLGEEGRAACAAAELDTLPGGDRNVTRVVAVGEQSSIADEGDIVGLVVSRGNDQGAAGAEGDVPLVAATGTGRHGNDEILRFWYGIENEIGIVATMSDLGLGAGVVLAPCDAVSPAHGYVATDENIDRALGEIGQIVIAAPVPHLHVGMIAKACQETEVASHTKGDVTAQGGEVGAVVVVGIVVTPVTDTGVVVVSETSPQAEVPPGFNDDFTRELHVAHGVSLAPVTNLGKGGIAGVVRAGRPSAASPDADFVLVGHHLDVMAGGDTDASGGGVGNGGAGIPPVVADLGVALSPHVDSAGVGRAPNENVVAGYVGLSRAAAHRHGTVSGYVRCAARAHIDAAPVLSIGIGIGEEMGIHVDIGGRGGGSRKRGVGCGPAGREARQGQEGGIPSGDEIHIAGTAVEDVVADVEVAFRQQSETVGGIVAKRIIDGDVARLVRRGIESGNDDVVGADQGLQRAGVEVRPRRGRGADAEVPGIEQEHAIGTALREG